MGIQSVAKRNHAAEGPPPDKAASRDDARVRRAARIVLSILVAGLALWVARGFMYPLAWAAVIAIATWPAYVRFRTLISARPSQLMAPLLFTLLVGAVLVVPVIVTVHQIAQGSDALVEWIGELRRTGIPIPSSITRLPIAREYLVAWWRANLGDPQAAPAGLRHVNLDSLTAWTGALSGELLQRLAVFLLTLVALFFLLRDGAFIAAGVVETADRVLGDRGERLASKIAEAVRSTVCGGRHPQSPAVRAVHDRLRDAATRRLGGILARRSGAARPRRKPAGSHFGVRHWRSHDGRRRLHLADVGRAHGPAPLPAGADRNFRRAAGVRIDRAVHRPGDHGCAADDLARMVLAPPVEPGSRMSGTPAPPAGKLTAIMAVCLGSRPSFIVPA